ncbi:Virulence sensor protein BvgS precursor [compost metagenome]
MNDCLFKPIGLTTLSQRLEALEPISKDQVFSLDSLHLLTGGDPLRAHRLLAELLNSNRLDLEELLGLPPASGRQAFIDVAHKIKGAARLIQASTLIDSCEALERMCHEDFSLDRLQAHKNRMRYAILELDQALQQQLSLQAVS